MTGLILGVVEIQNLQGWLRSQMRELEQISQVTMGVLEEAEQQQLNNKEVKEGLAKVKNTHYDLIDVFDECCLSSSSLSFFNPRERLYTARKIRDLIKKMKLVKEAAIDVLYLISIPADHKYIEFRQTISFVSEPKVYGRGREREILTSQLLSENNQEHGINYLSIVGIGGIGKTALAQLVFDSEEVREHFQLRCWVCVSDISDRKRIVKEILQSIRNEYYQMEVDFEVLVQRFHQTIEGKRCLFVLDDVWNEERSSWEALNRLFYGHAPGSAVLITTHSTRVAQAAGSSYRKVDRLSDDDSWSLFRQCAFRFENDNREDKNSLEELGRQIVMKCQGLPLVIKTFGSVLRYKATVSEWQQVLQKFEKFSMIDENNWIKSTFLLSYSHLPFLLRRRLVFCSIFPKNHTIDVDKLMKLWMAQNYSDFGKDDMETKAWLSFDQLLSCSFFHDLRRDDNGNLVCYMDGLLTDFIKHLAEKECSTVRVDQDTEVTTPLSFQEGRHWTLIVTAQASFPISVSCAEKVHTLIIIHEYSFIDPTTLSNLLSHFKRLRALDLSHCLVKAITHKIGKLMHLRYLDFSFNRDLKELPETLCDLSRLQSLNLNGCDNLQRLPSGIGKLIFLRHLEILWTKSLSYLPKGIGSLTSLRTLNRFFGNGVAGSKASNLGDLEKLSHLQGYISIDGLGGVTEVALAEKADLKNKKGLLGMDLWFSGVGLSISNDDAVLEALQPPPGLKSLGIFCYKGASFPRWMTTEMQLTELRHLMLSECSECKVLPPLGKLPFLESLEIRNMVNLKRVGTEYLGIESDCGDDSALTAITRPESGQGAKEATSAVRAGGGGGSHGKEIISDSGDGGGEVISAATGSNSRAGRNAVFPMLKKLHFCNMANWEKWDEITVMEENATIMPSISSLSIVRCTKLGAVPDYIKRIEKLSCRIEDCPLLKEEPL